MEEKSLKDTLTELQVEEQVEDVLKKKYNITRQQIRRETIAQRKELRSKQKEFAMKQKSMGGSAVIRDLPELDEENA